jgi:hypothetical protein
VRDYCDMSTPSPSPDVGRMKYRKLRIAWSVAWGVAAVLLIALWVRSYWYNDMYGIQIGRAKCIASSLRGSIVLSWDTWGKYGFLRGYSSVPASIARITDDISWLGFRFAMLPDGIGLILPMWFCLAVTIGIASMSWLRWRFSLRTLLIATTLVAVVLGLAIYAARN